MAKGLGNRHEECTAEEVETGGSIPEVGTSRMEGSRKPLQLCGLGRKVGRGEGGAVELRTSSLLGSR